MRSLSVATVFAALSGFIVLFVASWALGETRYDQFQAYWGLFFALAGLIDGLTMKPPGPVPPPGNRALPPPSRLKHGPGGWRSSSAAQCFC